MKKSLMSISMLVVSISMIAMFLCILVMIPCVIYLVATTGNLDKDALITMLMIPAQLAGQLMMGIYLWKAGYISTKKITWSPVSSPYLFFSALAVLTCGFVVSALAELMKWIPNIMEQSFDILQSGWGGILAIAVIGPVLEELLFRGAITKALLQPDKGNSAFSPFIRCFPYQSCPDTSSIPDRYPVCMDVLQDCQPHPLHTDAYTE